MADNLPFIEVVNHIVSDSFVLGSGSGFLIALKYERLRIETSQLDELL